MESMVEDEKGVVVEAAVTLPRGRKQAIALVCKAAVARDKVSSFNHVCSAEYERPSLTQTDSCFCITWILILIVYTYVQYCILKVTPQKN